MVIVVMVLVPVALVLGVIVPIVQVVDVVAVLNGLMAAVVAVDVVVFLFVCLVDLDPSHRDLPLVREVYPGSAHVFLNHIRVANLGSVRIEAGGAARAALM